MTLPPQWAGINVQRAGFTLLEIILILAVGATLMVFALNVFQDYQANSHLELTTEEMKSVLEEAQRYARNGKNAQKHGMHIETAAGTFTLFQGEDYATRDMSYDSIHTWRPGIVTYTGPADIIFSKLKATTTPVTLTLTNTTGKQRIININGAGAISD